MQAMQAMQAVDANDDLFVRGRREDMIGIAKGRGRFRD